MQGFDDFVKEINFKIGDGGKIRFWKDSWCKDSLLMTNFPNLYNIVTNKDALVKDYIVGVNGLVTWNITFIRHFNDW